MSFQKRAGRNTRSIGRNKALPAEIPGVAPYDQAMIHPVALQQARIAPRSLLQREMLQLQPVIGNQAVGRFLSQMTQPRSIHEKAIAQRCKGQEDGSVVSSFDETIRLDKDTEQGKVGDGGALTVYLTGSSAISHREVCLEWYDGIKKTGTHIAIHLATPELGSGLSTSERISKQLGSFFSTSSDEGKMKSVVQKLGDNWDPNFRAKKNEGSKTVRLKEEEKETKRQLLEGEVGKEYTYDIMNLGILGSESINCKDWAAKVAPEALI